MRLRILAELAVLVHLVFDEDEQQPASAFTVNEIKDTKCLDSHSLRTWNLHSAMIGCECKDVFRGICMSRSMTWSNSMRVWGRMLISLITNPEELTDDTIRHACFRAHYRSKPLAI